MNFRRCFLLLSLSLFLTSLFVACAGNGIPIEQVDVPSKVRIFTARADTTAAYYESLSLVGKKLVRECGTISRSGKGGNVKFDYKRTGGDSFELIEEERENIAIALKRVISARNNIDSSNLPRPGLANSFEDSGIFEFTSGAPNAMNYITNYNVISAGKLPIFSTLRELYRTMRLTRDPLCNKPAHFGI